MPERRSAVLLPLLLLLSSSGYASQFAADCEGVRRTGGSQEDVLECLRRRTRQLPKDPSAWLTLGLQLHSVNDVDEAVNAYQKVVELSPTSDLAATAHLHLGVILHGRGEHTDALTQYQRSLALSPSSPNTLLNMAIIQYMQGMTAEAMQSCKGAIDISPEYFAAHAQLAIMQQQVGDIDEAVDSYRTSVRLKPDYAPSYFNLGTALERTGDLTQAVEAYQQAVAIEGEGVPNPRFHGRLAAALVELGHWERGMVFHFDGSRHCEPMGTHCKHEHHSLGFAGGVDPSLFFNVGMVYLDTFMHLKQELFYLDQASRVLAHASRVGGGEENIYDSAVYALGMVHELSGRRQAATRLYKQALTAKPDSAVYLHALQRARRVTAETGTKPTAEAEAEDKKKVPLGHFVLGDSLYPRAAGSAASIDRYGCNSTMMKPHELLQHISSSTDAQLSELLIVVNPLPAQRKSYPAEDAVPDHVDNLLQHLNSTVLILSDVRELSEASGYSTSKNQERLKTLLHPNTTNAGALVEVVREIAKGQIAPFSTIDFVMFDNITNGCEHAFEFLHSAGIDPLTDAKIVMFHVNPALPPPVRTSLNTRDKREGAWGCSLSHATHLMSQLGRVLVQLDYTEALFIKREFAGSLQALPANDLTAYQLGFLHRPERLRCLGLFRGTVNHAEGDAWSRLAPEAVEEVYNEYCRDPSGYTRRGMKTFH